MEINSANENNRKLLVIEMLLFLAVSVAIVTLYIVYGEAVFRRLSPSNLEIVYRQAHIAILIAIFVLFNTTYFSFVSYRSVRMLILSGISAAFAGLYAVFFATSFMRFSAETGFDALVVDFQTSFIAVVFIIGVSISHHFDENIIYNGKLKLYAMIPLLIGALIALGASTVISMSTRFMGPSSIQIFIKSLNSISIVTGLLVFGLETYRFYNAQRRYLVRMGTSIALITLAVFVKNLDNAHPIESSVAFNVFLILALTSYIYAAFKYNIAMPIVQQKNTERQITLYAENLEKIVQKRTAELKKGTEAFLVDIEYAKKIQQSLLPGDYLKFNGAEFAAAYYPCERLSGDFYDIFMIDPDTLGMYVLDVSGHGIPAALMTMFCMNYIKTSERLINQYRAKKPHRNLKHFFDEFNKVNFPEEMHMVMFFAAYDMRQKVLTYCSGGLNTLPLLIRKNGEVTKLDQSSGFPICRVGNFFSPEYHSAKVELEVGDRVFFYTDGLTDKGKNQVFEESELIALLKAMRTEDVKGVRQSLVLELMEVVNRLDDDITFFIMEVL